ncbi:MAG: hypothetical protein K2G62_06185 [Oscillospiraceae bacterium]|nr:hypothetical protein [Oscillospiraceae bacterium]
MTAEEWKTVESALIPPFGRVKLKIDEYNVDIGVVYDKPLKYCYSVYIDGIFKSKWLLEDCEIRKRFCQKHTKSLLNAKQKQKLKRESKAFREQIIEQTTVVWYEPYFSSFRTLKSHFIKNNNSIELVEYL